jgi:hypothetical protein
VGSDRWVSQSSVDGRQSRWRSAERQYSFGGMSERRWSASANRRKALFCVSLECVECAFPWCTARPCSSAWLWSLYPHHLQFTHVCLVPCWFGHFEVVCACTQMPQMWSSSQQSFARWPAPYTWHLRHRMGTFSNFFASTFLPSITRPSRMILLAMSTPPPHLTMTFTTC